jgi:hypothetical protein
LYLIVNGSRLEISSLLFDYYSNTTYWRIVANADTTDKNEIKSGTGAIILKTNQSPYNGTCQIDNYVGYPLETNFTITCSRWIDDDGYITQYEFWGESKYKSINIYEILVLGNNMN